MTDARTSADEGREGAYSVGLVEGNRDGSGELEPLFEQLYANIPTMMHSIDEHGRLINVSDAWLGALGFDRHEVLGRFSSEFLTEASRQYAREIVLPEFFRRGRCDDVEYQMICKDGRVIDVLLSATLMRDQDGKPYRSVAVIRDVTERKRLEAMLAEQHEQIRVTLHSIGDAVISTDKAGRVEYLNPVAERLTGWRLEEARGCPLQTVFRIVDEQTRRRSLNPVEKCLAENRIIQLDDRIVLVSRDGAEYCIEDSAAPITSADGVVSGVVLVFRDVTDERRIDREISHRATHDSLTGLFNRLEFEGRLARAMESVRASGRAGAVLYVDLDQFKLVNDTCGHAAGDDLLVQIATLFAASLDGPHTLARLGGDEFGIILMDRSVEAASALAASLCRQVDALRFEYQGYSMCVGASIGVVPLDGRWESTSAIMQSVDSACYAAKDAGRNRVHVWSETDHVVLTRKDEMDWVRRLRQALDDNRFVLFGQEILPLQARAAKFRCEILLRLRESDDSLIQPAVFLPAAERFNIASRIDRWVVYQVFEWMSRHAAQLEHVDFMSVNISGQSIGDSAFHAYIEELLRTFPLDASKLCFEVTETAAITNLAAATEFVETLKRYGARFALDDFGSGASSFGYLKALPVDFLKIDGQFVKNVVGDALDRTVVRCIQEVAAVLGKETIAEFVETEEVAKVLKEMGIGAAQGFFFHRPEPLDFVLAARVRGAG